VNRRTTLRSIVAGVAAAFGAHRLAGGTRTAAQTKHIRLYVEMDVPPAREKELLDRFHNTFVPEAVRHEGYIRVKLLKKRAVLLGSAPAQHTFRFELEFESEALRQQWIASAAHQRVWPPVEAMMSTTKDYPVVLYDEV
jgi:hypothetical protein